MTYGFTTDAVVGNTLSGPTRLTGGRLLVDDWGAGAGLPTDAAMATRKVFVNPRGHPSPAHYIRAERMGAGDLNEIMTGLTIEAGDAWGSVRTLTVSGATSAAPIVVTAPSHGWHTGWRVAVYGALGNTAANGFWTITRIDDNTFSLDGSAGNGAYAGGGVVTNRGAFTGLHISVSPLVEHTGYAGFSFMPSHGDDTAAISISNTGPVRSIDGLYFSKSPQIAGAAYGQCIGVDANVDRALWAGGKVYSAVVSAEQSEIQPGASVVHGPNDRPIISAALTTGARSTGALLSSANVWEIGGGALKVSPLSGQVFLNDVDIAARFAEITARVANLEAQLAAIHAGTG